MSLKSSSSLASAAEGNPDNIVSGSKDTDKRNHPIINPTLSNSAEFAASVNEMIVASGLVDYGSFTRDTSTNLDWLDLTLSTNRSFNDVSTQFGPGGDFDGFRYATLQEVVAFLQAANIPDIDAGLTVANEAPVQALETLTGVTAPASPCVGGLGSGIYNCGVTGTDVGGALQRVVFTRRVTGAAEVRTMDTGLGRSTANPVWGHWLVRNSPEHNCVQPLSGLVGWWPADGTANDIVDGNHGALQNGASFEPGRFGQAFSFDGVDDVVQLPNAANLNFYETSPMTVEMWVYKTGGASVMHLLGKREACNNDFQYQLAFDSGGLVFGGLGYDGGYIRAQGVQLPLNEWAHVAGTFDGSILRLYVNGQSVWMGAGSLGPVNSAPMLIGGTGSCEHFAGLLDDVKIFNRALSAVEIQAEAEACITPTPTPTPTGTPTPPTCGTSQAQITTYDLTADWSDTSNPNGVWSYNEGVNPLPSTPLWQNVQPAWAYCCNGITGGFGHVPAWVKVRSSSIIDHQVGDVIVHSSDSGRGENFGPANTTWTSPADGVITISGSAWITRTTDRSNQWTLYLNGNPLSSGQMLGGGPYDRDNQFNFSAGTGGAAAIMNIPVTAGDLVKLEVTKLSTFGDFVGINLRITSSTCTPVDTTPPVITCPANISIAGNVPGSCFATINPGVASATDNSSGVTVSGVRSDGQALYAPYPLGMTTMCTGQNGRVW
jgi:hypothetical protein